MCLCAVWVHSMNICMYMYVCLTETVAQYTSFTSGDPVIFEDIPVCSSMELYNYIKEVSKLKCRVVHTLKSYLSYFDESAM